MTAPVIFVSYSHDSQEHKRWVLDLAIRLRTNGVDAILDQWDLGPGGDLPHFMEQSIAKSSRILMVCTERYVQKADAGAGGVGYEKMIVTADLLKRIDSSRVIPIVRQNGAPTLPTFLSSKLYIDLGTADRFETGFDQLLRELLNAPLFVKPALGAAPLLSATTAAQPTQPDPVTQLMLTLSSIYEMSNNHGAISVDTARRAMGGSKLFFDHALDLAAREHLISHSSIHIWVQTKGRQEMIKLSLNKGR